MTETEWLECNEPCRMLEFLRSKVRDRKLRLIAVASCERAKEFMEEDYHELADVALAFAEGRATVEEMRAVHANHRPSNDHPDRNAFYDTAGPDLVETIPYLIEDLADWIASCQVDDEGKSFSEWNAEKAVVFQRELAGTADQVRDIAGNPFRPITIVPAWLTPTVLALSQAAYDYRSLPSGILDNDRLAVLADALEDAGCTNADILNHCRKPGEHVRGCWVVDAILGKE